MIVIIPARYASTRLPGKPLADIGGKPLIQHVHERAHESGATKVIVATDDNRIAAVAQKFGAHVCMTSAAHRSGTDRLAEVIDLQRIDANEIVVNLQGDEPLMPPSLIRQVAETLKLRAQCVMSTACHRIHEHAEFANPNVVKVVVDQEGNALYFSRASIPWPRDVMANPAANATQGSVFAYRHIGIYAYRAGFVRRYAAWSACPLEEAEQLEQLRVLWHGERIAVCEAEQLPGIGVDTPEDLERVRRVLS